jgi:hypothetical protein
VSDTTADGVDKKPIMKVLTEEVDQYPALAPTTNSYCNPAARATRTRLNDEVGETSRLVCCIFTDDRVRQWW